MPHHANNKRIVKNTLALYFRQIITMFVALFTSRIVLQTLGVTDFGINNVVGGVVAMFGFISGTLMSITQRFITVELGKGSHISILRKIFSTSMILHILAAVVVLILAETVGLWFLNNKLVIPTERMIAANWVYRFAVFSFVLSLLNAPLMALIVSREDMHIYGYMGIFDVVARLITIYLLVIVSGDKLIFFALFGFSVSFMVFLFYGIYCRRKYQEAKFSFVWDKSLIKELGVFGGWIFLGTSSYVLSIQGVNILLNMFFGPAINAARGISVMINTALVSFGNNFKQTLNPQLTKLYAAKNIEQMWRLNERGTRFTFFLIFIFSVPVLLKTEFILTLWLGVVPEYTVIFTKLIIIDILVSNALSSNLVTIRNAIGKIKISEFINTAYHIAIFAISYLLCKFGCAPQYVFIIPILLRPIVTVANLVVIKKQIDFSFTLFAQKALIPIFFVLIISLSPFYFLQKSYPNSFEYSLFIILASVLWTGIVVMFIGFRENERIKVFAFAKRKILLRK